jgi:prolyl oligopeptidase
MITRCTVVALVAAIALSGPANARDATAPVTRTTDATDVLHGVRVADPYRWLEDGKSAEVQAWTEAQSKRTRAYFDSLPFRAPLRAKLETLVKQASPRYFGLDAAGGQLFAVYLDPKFQQPMIVVMGQDADPTKARVVLDPNKLDPTGGTAFDWFVPSPDGERIAVSLSKGGSEDGSLHVFDVATGRQVGEAIPRVQYPTAGGDAAWAPDGKGFWYTRYPDPDRPADEQHFHQKVWFHRLGEDPKTDAQVFGDGLPKVAEIRLDYSDEAGALLVTVQKGDGGEFAHYVRGEDGRFVQVTRFEDGVTYARFGPDRALYLVSQAAGTPRGEIRRLAPGTLDLERATRFVPQGEDVIAASFRGDDAFVFLGERIYVRYLAGGPSRVRIFDLTGAPKGDLPLPGIAAVDEIEPVGKDLLYSVETYVAPLQFYRLADGKSVPTALKVTSPVSFDDMEVLRVFATSKDGTRVPLNIVRRKGTKLDATNPVLLYGYGGYAISQTPRFLGPTRRMWFDAGGIYVVANIRGGGEYGREWHEQGALTHKQNVFDDFIAAAEYLVNERYTSPERFAIMGGSNGGLLVGAVTTQRPELFRAVVAQVGVFDMLRVELDPNGQFNTTEFGTVKDEAQFKALYAYSPYHRVRDGVKYPAMFLPAGANDGRVNPLNSRKMSARLQAATDSGRPIYLYVTSGAGHGLGSSLSVQLDQSADWLSFLIDQLGMKWVP